MRVFISHSSRDEPAVQVLATGRRARGIDVWLDIWEIAPGDDIVARINQGLQQADAGVIVFSEHSRDSRWVESEVSCLTYARICEGKVLIPVTIDNNAWVPPLLRPLARRAIGEIDAIADALLGRRPVPPPLGSPDWGSTERVLISLEPAAAAGEVRVQVRIGPQQYGDPATRSLPPSLRNALADYLRGFRSGLRRSPDAAERTSLESAVADLGRQLRALCLPGDAGDAVADLLDGCPNSRCCWCWTISNRTWRRAAASFWMPICPDFCRNWSPQRNAAGC